MTTSNHSLDSHPAERNFHPVEITIPIMDSSPEGFIPTNGMRLAAHDLDYVNKNKAGQKSMSLFTGVYATNSREQLQYACVKKVNDEIRAMNRAAGDGNRQMAPTNLWMLDVYLKARDKQAFFHNLLFEDALATGTVRMDRILNRSAKDVIARIRAWMIRTYGGNSVLQVDFDNLSALTTNFPQFIPWFFSEYPQMDMMIHSVYMSYYKKPFTVITYRQDRNLVERALVRSMPHVKVDTRI